MQVFIDGKKMDLTAERGVWECWGGEGRLQGQAERRSGGASTHSSLE